MGNELLSAKVVVQEEEPRIQNVTGTATAVSSCEGITERGPVGVPTLTTSDAEWVRIFGGNIAASNLRAQVEGFYRNNPSGQLWTNRVVHYSDIDDSSSKTSDKATVNIATGATAPSAAASSGANQAPFAMHDADTIVVAIDGGGDLVTTINAVAAVLDSGNSEPFTLADDDDLKVKIDGGAEQTVVFHTSEFADISQATADEVAAVLNASLVGASAINSLGAVEIVSDKKGTGSHVQVTGGLAAAGGKLNFSGTAADGSGNVADVDAVTGTEVQGLIASAIGGAGTVGLSSGRISITSATAGVSSQVQVKSSSVNGDTELGFDNAIHAGSDGAAVDTVEVDGKSDGTYAAALSVVILDASSGDPAAFNVEFVRGTSILETWPNLTMDPDGTRYLETIVNDPDNGSELLQLTDLEISGTALQRRPANGTYAVVGGNDGLSGLVDADYVGTAAGKTGLRAFDQTMGIRILTVPSQATAVILTAMVSYAEIVRSNEMFAVLDCPEGMTAAEVREFVVTTAALRGLSEFAAFYWPRVKISNPNRTLFGPSSMIVVGPSLHIAGMYGRVDASKPGGVWVPPAGEVVGNLIGVTGVETDEVLDEGARDLVFPDLINPIVKYPGTSWHCDGARTLKDNGNFPTIGERRGVIFVETALKDFLRSKKHANPTDATLAQIDRSVNLFLVGQMNNDAFQSKDPAKAFLVDVSKALNPPSSLFARKLKVRIGLATNKPSEFIILLVAQDTRALEEELAALLQG